MTSDTRVAAVTSAIKPFDRKASDDNPEGLNVGGMTINRSDGRDGYGAEVARLMVKGDGTYRWDFHDPTVGKKKGLFNNIYEAMASDLYAPRNPSLRERMQAAEDRGHEARSGVTSLAKWLDEQWGVPLYRCVGDGSGNHVVVITLNPELIVDEQTGMTAAEAQIGKDKRAVVGQIGAAYRRLGREKGEEYARNVLDTAAREVTSAPLPEPRHKERAATYLSFSRKT